MKTVVEKNKIHFQHDPQELIKEEAAGVIVSRMEVDFCLNYFKIRYKISIAAIKRLL